MSCVAGDWSLLYSGDSACTWLSAAQHSGGGGGVERLIPMPQPKDAPPIAARPPLTSVALDVGASGCSCTAFSKNFLECFLLIFVSSNLSTIPTEFGSSEKTCSLF